MFRGDVLLSCFMSVQCVLRSGFFEKFRHLDSLVYENFLHVLWHLSNEEEENVSELLTTQVVEQEQFAPIVQAEVQRSPNNVRCEVPADMNSNEIIGSIFN